MKERILKIIKQEQLTSAKFADMIGVPRSSISHVLSGRNNPSLDFVQKVLHSFPNIDTDWLLDGQGTMYKRDPQKILFEDEEDFENEPESEVDAIEDEPEDESDDQPEESHKSEQETQQNRPVQPANTQHANAQQAENDAAIAFSALGNKKVVRIVIFYTDKTFVDYSPSPE